MAKKIFLALVALFIVVLIIYSSIVNYSVDKGKDQDFVIEKGQGVSLIAKNLKKQDLIKSILVFKIYSKISGQQASFKEGSYILNPKMSIKQIVSELTPRIFLKPEEKLTFIEGWNIRDYSKLLNDRNLISPNDFLSLVGEPLLDYRFVENKKYPQDYSEEFSFLKDKPKFYSLEGYLFPDTYRFFIDTSDEEIIKKMLSNFDNKLTMKMREDIQEQGKTIHEIITMASIIEKEVPSVEDMKVVSGIFWDRIKNGQALESCATLAYILDLNKTQYSYEDTRIESPYNTYINRGLPPGPIANPGLNAILASIYPESTDYNYFLSNPKNGETIFSKTYQEHLNNKAKYIK
ncbi:MAG: endolytic transglycosylase MltG [Patescibacteria group bacterium]|nr:endolytic transglycosylase MltG [Patescibacteria group bacterium]